MIAKNKYFLLAILKVILSLFKGFENNKKLSIMGLILKFYKNNFFRKKVFNATSPN